MKKSTQYSILILQRTIEMFSAKKVYSKMSGMSAIGNFWTYIWWKGLLHCSVYVRPQANSLWAAEDRRQFCGNPPGLARYQKSEDGILDNFGLYMLFRGTGLMPVLFFLHLKKNIFISKKYYSSFLHKKEANKRDRRSGLFPDCRKSKFISNINPSTNLRLVPLPLALTG